MQRLSRKPRVFLGLTEVAGYYRNLELGFRQIGVDARFFDLSPNPFGYGNRPQATDQARVAAVTRPGRVNPRRRFRAVGWRVTRRAVRLVKTIALMAWGIVRYDVFIFYGLDSFLWYRDLPILRALGKTVIYVLNGSDHRPPYLNGKFVRKVDQHKSGWLTKETMRVKRRVERIERHANAIVALSSSAQFHTRPFLHFLAMGLPHPEAHALAASPAGGGPTRILHSPSDPISKGSDHIRACVARLQSEGHDLEYIELVGRPNAEVLAAVARASFVVDEMYSDTPMAGFAVEAAWQGKATVVSGLYAAEVAKDLPADLIPPTVFCLPDEIDQAIERMVVDVSTRDDVGRRARAYVETRWRPAEVAARFLAVMEGRAPAEWSYQPDRLRYFGGWGMPQSMVRKGVSTILDQGGVSALKLDHHPALLRAVVEFAR